MIVAKPVIDQQFWILQEDNRKIGNIEVCAGGYQVKIENRIETYRTISMVAERANIHFQDSQPSSQTDSRSVHGFPTTSEVHNPVWDVPHQLPLYTKTLKSRSWFAAGWYQVKRGRTWRIVQDPKLITLERYAYHGPFRSREMAAQQCLG